MFAELLYASCSSHLSNASEVPGSSDVLHELPCFIPCAPHGLEREHNTAGAERNLNNGILRYIRQSLFGKIALCTGALP